MKIEPIYETEDDEEDYDAIVKEAGSGYGVQRYKGLGEMTAEDMELSMMSKENRHLEVLKIAERRK